MRLLVTGGAGFIGANFVRYWNQHHADDVVVNFDKLTYAANPENLRDLEGLDNYVFEQGDIADKERVQQVFARHRPDVVVHFAAESHVDRSLSDRSIFVITNVLGTQVLLDAALEHGVTRFHHVSTDEVFGQIGEDEDRAFDENTAYDPRNPYSASKAASDHLVRSYGRSLGLPITITNCSNNYGPFHTPEKMIPLAISNLLEGKPVPVYGEGRQVRDWLYVEDHCRAIEVVLDRGRIGETYCVGGLQGDVPNLEIARRLCRLLDRDPDQWIEFVPDRKGHDFKYAVNWSHIHNELGWSPQHSLDQGLSDTVTWFRNNEAWWKTIKARQPQFERVTV